MAFYPVKKGRKYTMIYFGILIGLIIMAAMTYMALNKRSDFHMRIASLIALAVMIITIIVCLFLVLTNRKLPQDESVVLVGVVQEVPVTGNNNSMVLLLLAFFLISLFVLIFVLAMRENRRQKSKTKKE
jgi:cytochrome bd-type quinol oxidase subunit 2